MHDDALKIWREKLDFFEKELASAVNPNFIFNLKKEMETCHQNISRLDHSESDSILVKESLPTNLESQILLNEIINLENALQRNNIVSDTVGAKSIENNDNKFSIVAQNTYNRLKNAIEKHRRYSLQDLTPEFACEGDLALVCKGTDKRLNRDIAIKALKIVEEEPSVLSNSEKFLWFKKAVIESCKISDESSFISIYEAHILNDYKDHEWEKTTPYFTMQYIDGASLRTHINNGDRFEPKVIREFIVNIISAIITCHEKNISHRNIRPSNIMLQKTESGVLRESKLLLSPLQWSINITNCHQLIKNLDYKLENIDRAENNINYFLEELAYLPPELFDCYQDGHEERFLSDQYMIGLLAYELLSHKLPLRINNFNEVNFRDNPASEFRAIKERFHEGIFTFNDEIDELKNCPESFKNAIYKMISINPKNRFQSLKEARDLIDRKYEYILAKESFYRCIKHEDDFIDAVYDNFQYTFDKNRDSHRFQAFFGKMKSNSQQWNRHRLIIKEAILLLLAFHDQDEFSHGLDEENILSETNILSRIAQSHVDINIDGYQVSEKDFDNFNYALISTICGKNHSSINKGEPLDPYCKSDPPEENRINFSREDIKSSWRLVLNDGIEYMKRYLIKSKINSH